jgi:hypothetical protein
MARIPYLVLEAVLPHRAPLLLAEIIRLGLDNPAERRCGPSPRPVDSGQSAAMLERSLAGHLGGRAMRAVDCPCCGATFWYIPEQVGSLASCPHCFTAFPLPREWGRAVLVFAGLSLLLLGLPTLVIRCVLGVQAITAPQLYWTVPPGDNAAALRLLLGMDWRLAVGGGTWLLLVLMSVAVALKAGVPARMAALVLGLVVCLAVVCFLA